MADILLPHIMEVYSQKEEDLLASHRSLLHGSHDVLPAVMRETPPSHG